MIKKILGKVYSVIYKVLSILPVRKKTIVFESFLGKQYSDNPKAIYNYMRENHSEYKLYWSFDRRNYHFLKDNVEYPLSRFGIRWLFVMARTEFLITNSRMPHWLPKSNGQTYVQTWHGTPLKKLGLDIKEIHIPGTTTKRYKEDFINETLKWDILISPNEYSTEIFKNAFQYENKILESGYPRNDILYNKNNKIEINKIKDGLKVPKDKKIILYAPTWRDNQFYSAGKYKLNLKIDLPKMKAQLGEEYIILIRAHYLVAENLDLMDYTLFAYDVSLYPDINELYLISDLLITDYSSVFFDYANLRRPIIFFVYDIEEYRDDLRGFYFDLEKKPPGPIVKTTDEVIQEIKQCNINNGVLDINFQDFHERYCSIEDGKSSERVVKYILKK